MGTEKHPAGQVEGQIRLLFDPERLKQEVFDFRPNNRRGFGQVDRWSE
jgi:hypothetical protein